MLPTWLRPMLAERAESPFDSPRHLFDLKWDGYRCLGFLEKGRTTLISRNGHDISYSFPELRGLHRLLRVGEAVVDGEVVAFEGDRPSFGQLQRRGRMTDDRQIALAAASIPVVFVAFDLLFVGGDDLTRKPLEFRLERLSEVLGTSEAAAISQPVPERGKALFEGVVRSRGLEGLVAKELGSPYVPGRRTGYWLKIRNVRGADCLIGGYTLSGPGRLASLILGVFVTGPPGRTDEGSVGDDPLGGQSGEGLVCVGKVGTGISGEEGRRLLEILEPAPRSPFPRGVPPDIARGAFWVRPDRVCSVEYLELSSDGRLRHPSYKGLREDKSPGECLWGQEVGPP